MTEQQRAYVYRVIAVVLVVLVGRGIITGDDASDITQVVLAVLGLAASGLASANTSTKG